MPTDNIRHEPFVSSALGPRPAHAMLVAPITAADIGRACITRSRNNVLISVVDGDYVTVVCDDGSVDADYWRVDRWGCEYKSRRSDADIVLVLGRDAADRPAFSAGDIVEHVGFEPVDETHLPAAATRFIVLGFDVDGYLVRRLLIGGEVDSATMLLQPCELRDSHPWWPVVPRDAVQNVGVHYTPNQPPAAPGPNT